MSLYQPAWIVLIKTQELLPSWEISENIFALRSTSKFNVFLPDSNHIPPPGNPSRSMAHVSFCLNLNKHRWKYNLT